MAKATKPSETINKALPPFVTEVFIGKETQIFLNLSPDELRDKIDHAENMNSVFVQDVELVTILTVPMGVEVVKDKIGININTISLYRPAETKKIGENLDKNFEAHQSAKM